MLLPITAIYLLIFSFLFVMLSYNVIKLRTIYGVGFGDGGHDDLKRAIAAQLNYAQYTPFLLFILAICELSGLNEYLAYLLGFLMLYGRGSHLYGVLVYETTAESGRDPLRFRKTGMVATFAAMLIGSVFVMLYTYQ